MNNIKDMELEVYPYVRLIVKYKKPILVGKYMKDTVAYKTDLETGFKKIEEFENARKIN